MHSSVLFLLLTKRGNGVIVVWVVDILESARVEVVTVTTDEPLLSVDEEGNLWLQLWR